MAGKVWTEKEIEILKKYAPIKGCKIVADKIGRTVRSVQHKFGELGLEKERAKVGDEIHGWRILEIYQKYCGNQHISFAKVVSLYNSDLKTEFRLTRLTNRQVAWSDPKRPDNIGRNITHGESKDRLYRIWYGMKNRCLNPKQVSYKHYGGRGIKICDEWMNYETFSKWAKDNGYSDDLTLDRQDVNGNYCPKNCKWSSWGKQVENRRFSSNIKFTAFGETKSIYEWLNDNRCNLNSVASLEYRINAGWEPERAITQPSERKARPKLIDWLKETHPDILEEYYSV